MRIFILVASCFVCTLGMAQTGLSSRSKKAIALYTEADNYRVRMQFEKAINLLNQAIARDEKFEEAYARLAGIYKSLNRVELAAVNFEHALRLTTDPKRQQTYWYELGGLYFKLGKYDQSEGMLERFITTNKNRDQVSNAQRILESIEFARTHPDNVTGYTQKVLSDTVNHFFMQYFPVLTADQQQMIFTARLGPTSEHDEDLMITRRDDNGNWSIPAPLSPKINTRENEGTCTISADGRKLIFTACAGRKGYGSCDLFESVRVGNEWSEPVNLGPGVNSSFWESQPSLSADGRVLYFVSDRRNGRGGRDIWVSHLQPDRTWGEAVNAGPIINSGGDEVSPFIHPSGRILFFASNGHPGFGGFDIFSSDRTDDGWSTPVNLGRPVNNNEDQFSLFITADGTKGYYSHEDMHTDGISRGKIYQLGIPESKQIRFKTNYVKGFVTSSQTKQPLRAAIEMINLGSGKTESLVDSDSVSGEYLITLTQGARYALYVNKTGYLFKSLHFNYSEVTDLEPIIVNIELDEVKEGSESVLNNIFFDTDKYALRPESRTELDRLVQFMKSNPAVKIEIGGHTDNVGSDGYNKDLSQKRAEAVFTYLISNGVESRRLTAVGYGYHRPVASNDTEENRQLNRRIAFSIID